MSLLIISPTTSLVFILIIHSAKCVIMITREGRVIQVLPAPTLNSAIAFAKNFNRAINQPANINEYPKWGYDKLDLGASICSSPATTLHTNWNQQVSFSWHPDRQTG